MSDRFEEENTQNTDQSIDGMSFEQMLDVYDSKTGREFKPGDMVEGQIISIGENSVYLDTGTKSDGVVDKSSLLDEDGQFQYSVGDILKLYVVSLSESEVILSKSVSGAGMAVMIEDAYHARTPVEGRVSGVIKGGFSVEVLGKRAFCPVSQIDVKYVETPEDYEGQTHQFLITKYEERGRNIVVSRRELLNEQIREERTAFMKELAEGDTVQGKVIKLMSYGAFIELGPGVEGMAHISELSWSRVEKPDEVVRVDDILPVKVLKIEKLLSDSPKISLSVKQTSGNPWDDAGTTFSVGDQVTGKVVRLTTFGAFVEIAPGIDGLVHVSEISHIKRVLRPEDEVSVGEAIQVMIKAIDMDSKRISLSMKDAAGDPWTGVVAKYPLGSIVDGTLEKKEGFGLFIRLEPGITGLMPMSNLRQSANAGKIETLKPGDDLQVLVQVVDEDNRRMTLAAPDQKSSGNWKQFAKSTKQGSSFGSMESVLRAALEKK